MKHIDNPALIKSANKYKDDYFRLLSANGVQIIMTASIGMLPMVQTLVLFGALVFANLMKTANWH